MFRLLVQHKRIWSKMGRPVNRKIARIWYVIAVGVAITLLHQMMMSSSPDEDSFSQDIDNIVTNVTDTVSETLKGSGLVVAESGDGGDINQGGNGMSKQNPTIREAQTIEAIVLLDFDGKNEEKMPLYWYIQWLEYIKYAGVDHVQLYCDFESPSVNMWKEKDQLGMYVNSGFISLNDLSVEVEDTLWQEQITAQYTEKDPRANLWLLFCRMDQYPINTEDTGIAFLRNFTMALSYRKTMVRISTKTCIGQYSVTPPNLLIENRQCSGFSFEARNPVIFVRPARCKNGWPHFAMCNFQDHGKKSFFMAKKSSLQVFDYSRLRMNSDESETLSSNVTYGNTCCQLLTNTLRPLVMTAFKRFTVDRLQTEVEILKSDLRNIKTSISYLTRYKEEHVSSNFSAMLLPYHDTLIETEQLMNASLGQQAALRVEEKHSVQKYFLSTVLINRVFLGDLFNITLWELWQFLEYQRYMGVEHVYWYDTAHSEDEFMEEGLKVYIDAGYITYYRFHDLMGPELDIHFEQDMSYDHFFKNHREETAWVTICDLDEYFFMPGDTAPNFLARLLKSKFPITDASSEDTFTQLVVSCMTFLGAPKKDLPALMIERYQRRSPKPEPKFRRPKLILQTAAWARLMKRNPHNMVMTWGQKFYPEAQYLRFNHYWGGRLTSFKPETDSDVQDLVADNSMNPIANALWEKLSFGLREMERLKVDIQMKRLIQAADRMEGTVKTLLKLPPRFYES